jgi:hypothetical protein
MLIGPAAKQFMAKTPEPLPDQTVIALSGDSKDHAGFGHVGYSFA